MKKKITYKEPFFDPFTHEYDYNKLTEYTVIANNEEEYEAHMAAITNPARGIPQESIVIEDAKPTVEELKEALAETDYKIIKSLEYQLAGLAAPYDIAALHAERQELRDRINAA